MMHKQILYIGNMHSENPTTFKNLSFFLNKEGYTIYEASAKVNKFLRLLDMCFCIINLRKKVDYVLIDTYSTSNFYYALVCSQLARFLKLKYIPILHGGNLPHRLEKFPKMSALIFKNSDVNISPSDYLKYEFENKGYVVQKIPNILETEKYPFLKREIIKSKLLYVRAFDNIYNPTMAIEVLRKLVKIYPEAKLCMIGPDKDGSLKDVKSLISKYNLENNVEITGFLPKSEWHKKSEAYDIFINTTNIDNTPVSVIEAMALGLSVVSTNVGGIPYVIENLEDGLLVAKNDVEKMVEYVISIINGNHKDIAINARAKVEKFGWESIRNDWLKILR
ncbi:glycosyltransferase family 4 protein [Polaribacter sp. IC073]|uniref:glycosyltransferase family 4 protein n=1 Tax=Polaribacter sp. IC073 TaxID=2508540 RepID=UPI0011BF9185|nr:glycosyltransferase family 4 protein [Polaribacter sp. IC073]TXD49137.1 glycosyltransferase family 4 protein [Polaribacter sp. IC073]